MKERGILMSGPMALACHDGSKGQTLRVVKPQPTHLPTRRTTFDQPGGIGTEEIPVEYWTMGEGKLRRVDCPYGRVGDRLWVRETWFDNCPGYGPERSEVHYRADGLPDMEGEESEIVWSRSLFMPRWASRTTLEIIGVRVHRVQAITEAQAVAEGVASVAIDGYDRVLGNWFDHREYVAFDPLTKYRLLWDHINAKPKPIKKAGKVVAYESFPWDGVTETREHRGKPLYVRGNPWVWAVEFKKIGEAA